MVELTNHYRTLETIETPGIAEKIRGISEAKTFKKWIEGRIKLFRNKNNQEMVFALEGVKQAYLKFHPEIENPKVYMESWRGKSGFEVTPYPEYFDVVDYRKSDKYMEAKDLHHKVYKTAVVGVLKTLNGLKIGESMKTRDFAEKWCRINHIWENSEGKKTFDNDGFNWSNVQGCRATLFSLYYPLKVLEFYKVIEHKKSGKIIKLKEKFEFLEQI